MADINIEDITNGEQTGIFDKLMSAVNTQIENQYLENRITSSDYASVYLGSLQAVLGQSIQYGLQEKLTESQIAGIEAENLLKAKQLELVEEQIKNSYTERVLKDKQIAKLGLDNVMKNAETSKVSDSNFVYSPKYEEL